MRLPMCIHDVRSSGEVHHCVHALDQGFPHMALPKVSGKERSAWGHEILSAAIGKHGPAASREQRYKRSTDKACRARHQDFQFAPRRTRGERVGRRLVPERNQRNMLLKCQAK